MKMSKFFKSIKMEVGRVIWNTSETLNIPLGKYAPKVFGWMIGVKGEKKN